MSAATQSLNLRATVLTASGERVQLKAIATTRTFMDRLVERLYPDARMVSVIVKRAEALAC